MFTPSLLHSNVKRVCATLFVGLLATAPLAHAVVYDVATDFSLESNPNGVWIYGYSGTLGGTLNFYDQASVDGAGNQLWRSSVVQSLGAPADWKRTDGTAAFHPGQGGEYSVYRFTAPSQGTYNLSVVFTGIDSTTTDVHVLQGSNSLFSGNISGFGSTSNYATSLSLAANDIVDFAVGFGNGSFYSDATGIAATLTPVPEPETYALLLSGLVLVGFTARRRIAQELRGRLCLLG